MRARGSLVVCLLALVLVTSACGSRLPDDVLEALDARGTATNTGSSDETSTNAATDGSASGPSSTTAVAGNSASRGTTGTGGTTPTSSGSSGGNNPVQAASKCKDAKSGAPGVSDTEIKVASIVTDSGPLPGATEGSFRGAASYFAMVNSSGGLCGRKVTLLKGDDGLDPAKGRGEFLRLEPQVLAFVGSFAVADSGYSSEIARTKVPYIATLVDPSGRGARGVMPKTAEGIANSGPFAWLKQKNPKVKNAAVLYAAVGGVSANVPGFEKAIEKAGFTRKYTESAQVTSPDYTANVQKAQDEGIQFLYLFAFEVNMHVRINRNMRQQNYDPPIKGSNIGYNTRFSQLLAKDGDGWENHQTHLQFLDPKEKTRSKGLAQFMDWNERVFPGAQLDLFPVSGWGRAALFTEAMQKIEGTITREALIDSMYKITKFDGGGIEAPLDPRTGLGDGCWNMAEHRGGKWVRSYPTDKLYECDIGEQFKYL